ncbi:MAG: epimerase [Deltaproteobacteria bacterium HGW-Deltaproteobacteria-15]|jgi:UDP-glucose 4-epimerase|nr:MAG: epimerase [Deltaproteobacteria bacterium HGW-Deltaproteobacteria-15]
MDKNVFITGAGGYIGSLTIAALAGNRRNAGRIIAADVRQPADDRRFAGVQYITADIRDPGLSTLFREHRADVVVHLAAVVNPGKKPDPVFLHSVEVEGTSNVLKACLSAGVKKFIYTSSGAAYGYYSDNPEWLKEDDPIRGNPEFPYSNHKRQVEEMLAEHRRVHPELKQLIFRCCTILGATTKNQITDLFDKRSVLGLAGCEIPFVLIWDMDVVGAILKGIVEEDSAGVYNVAGDGILTMKEMSRIMDKPYMALPPGLVKGALWLMKKVGATQYGPEQVNFLRYRPVLSNRRLKEEFGYSPRKTTREVFIFFLECRKSGGLK